MLILFNGSICRLEVWDEILSKETLNIVSKYFCFVLPKNQQFLTYPVAGIGKDGLAIGKRRINWLWYKPITYQEYEEILIGKSGKKYNHGIPPQEIKDKYLDYLKSEAELKLPKITSEFVIQEQTNSITTNIRSKK